MINNNKNKNEAYILRLIESPFLSNGLNLPRQQHRRHMTPKPNNGRNIANKMVAIIRPDKLG